MADKIPFDEDVLTLVMGLEGPGEPGQHGRKHAPMPEMDAVDLVTSIRDMCEEFLKKAGKGPEPEPKPGKDQEKPEGEPAMEEEEK